MLKQLKAKNFRKLTDATVTFTKGLNVVRGQNEAGKSTMLEAITYALFGVSACRTSLAEMVTWGEKESSLKVELIFEIEGTEYTITRSKSGAEVNYTGGRVVGQKEVAAFVGRLFGMASKNVNHLVLAGQGNIRGALSEGSTKTSELIEQLANFSVIDDVIELIGQKLTTGATAPFEERAAAATQELAQLEAALVVPDTAADEARLIELDSTKFVVEEEAESIMAAIGPLAERRDELRAAKLQYAKLEERVRLLEEQAKAAFVELQAHEGAEPASVDPLRIAALRTTILNWNAVQERLKGKLVVERTAYPEDNFWEGDLQSFAKEIDRNASALRQASDRRAEILADLRVKKAEIVAAGMCSHCGQDFSQLPATKERNNRLEAEVAHLEMEAAATNAVLAMEEETRASLEAVKEEQQRITTALARYGKDVEWDTSVVPHRPRWVFSDDTGFGNIEDLKQQLAGGEAAQAAHQRWQARQKVLFDAAERLNKDERAARKELDKGVPGLDELPAIEAECERLNKLYSELYSSLVATQTEAAEIQARVSSAKAAYEAAVQRVDAARKAKEEAERLIDEIGFNNALLKRVRAARPIIANKLWSMVLAAVSRYFSSMRGVDSVVTKDADGFKVDGRIIESLSGSTLDILGLAIRLALVRTFLPQTPLLILDEPSAACDVERTEAMMGFLVGCGFDQLLLVTHEDMSEKVAENLVTI